MSTNCGVTVVKCQSTKREFGVRWELMPVEMNDFKLTAWWATWAYEMKPGNGSVNSSSNQNENIMKGDFLIHNTYPGCPYCPNHSIAICPSCKNLFCVDNDQTTVVCPWDGMRLFKGPVDNRSSGGTTVRGTVDYR